MGMGMGKWRGWWVLFSVLVGIGIGRPVGAVVPREAGVEVPLVMTEVPGEKPLPARGQPRGLMRGEVMDRARLVWVSPEGKVRVLSQGFAAACDPDVSFDGRRILFAGKKQSGDRWSLWEMEWMSGRVREVLRMGRDCRQPIYLSSLFTLDSPKPWFTVAFVGTEPWGNEAGTGPDTDLFCVRLDGTELRRITSDPGNDLDPVQLPDGRLVYAGWRWPHEGRLGPGRWALFGIFHDGEDLALYGAEQGLRVQGMPCVLESGQVVFVENRVATADGAGRLACVSMWRPHHSYRPLTRLESRWWYLYPTPWKGDWFLVVRRAADGSGPTELVMRNLAGEERPVWRERGWQVVQAKVLRPRTMPDGRSTTADYGFTTGQLYALSCYDTEREVRRVLRQHRVVQVRVVEGVPLPEGRRKRWGRRIVGTAPVYGDGSFFLEVPSDTPLELQVLDTNGVALWTCGWIWVKPREKRGCIACHEDPERVPENRWVEAVRHGPTRLTVQPAQRRSLGFREDILPMLNRYCGTAGCHGSPGPRLFWDPKTVQTESGARKLYRLLTGRDPEEKERTGTAVRRYVVPGRARVSPLAWRLIGKRMGLPWDQDIGQPKMGPIRKMPPEGARQPSSAWVRRLMEWIDLGTPWERVPSNAVGLGPKRIVVRREEGR